MAKKNVEEAMVQNPVGAPEGTQEGTQQLGGEGTIEAPTNAPESPESPEAPEAPEAPAVVSPQRTRAQKVPEVQNAIKKVKIHATDDINAIIAGMPYVIAKDKEAQVPTDVAAILVNARKAYRL